jgi:hypothetical protein
MNFTPENVVAGAVGLGGISLEMLRRVQTYLLCQWANSAAFSYTPATLIMQWTDSNGSHSGNLAAFNATAVKSTVTFVGFNSIPLVSISNLGDLPALTSLTIIQTDGLLSSIDLSHNPLLATANLYTNRLASIILSSALPLTYLDLSDNRLSAAQVNSVLIALSANGHAGGDVFLQAQFPAAPPSGAGLVAKSALLAAAPPWMVVTD